MFNPSVFDMLGWPNVTRSYDVLVFMKVQFGETLTSKGVRRGTIDSGL